MTIESASKPMTKEILSRCDWKISILFLLPLILISINASWLFIWPLQGLLDAWIYTGYFIDLEAHFHHFPPTYFGARLPWILPGYFAYKFFSPIVANIALHLTFFYAAIFSLYSILKKLLSARAAFLTCLLMGTYVYVLHSFGTNYIDGAGITYLLLTLLFLTPAKQSKNRRSRLFIAGVFCSCLLFTQIFLVTFSPLLALYYFYFHRQFELRRLSFFLLGFLTVMLFFCCVSEFYHGKFFFFFPALKTAGRLTLQNDFWMPLSKWGKNATWAFIPLMVACGSLITFFFYRSIKEKSVLFLQAFYLLTCLIFLFFEFLERQPVIQLSFYLCYVFPALFLALGGQLFLLTRQLSSAHYLFATLIAGGVAFLAFSLAAYVPYWQMAFLLFAVCTYLCLFFRLHLIGTLCLSLAFGILNSSLHFSKKTTPSIATQKSAYSALMSSIEKIQAIDPQRRGIFWFNNAESQNSLYWAICSHYLCHRRLLNDVLPDMERIFILPKEKRKIFVLSTLDNPVEEANKGLITRGFIGSLDEEFLIEEGPIRFKLTSLTIKSANISND